MERPKMRRALILVLLTVALSAHAQMIPKKQRSSGRCPAAPIYFDPARPLETRWRHELHTWPLECLKYPKGAIQHCGAGWWAVTLPGGTVPGAVPCYALGVGPIEIKPTACHADGIFTRAEVDRDFKRQFPRGTGKGWNAIEMDFQFGAVWTTNLSKGDPFTARFVVPCGTAGGGKSWRAVLILRRTVSVAP